VTYLVEYFLAPKIICDRGERIRAAVVGKIRRAQNGKLPKVIAISFDFIRK
jgi:hypothetical protein